MRSFQDVAAGGTPSSFRQPFPTSSGPGHYAPNGNSSSRSSNGSSGNGGGTPTVLREALLQFQKQVVLYEKLGREVGGPRDDAELRAQLKAQETVVRVSEVGIDSMD